MSEDYKIMKYAVTSGVNTLTWSQGADSDDELIVIGIDKQGGAVEVDLDWSNDGENWTANITSYKSTYNYFYVMRESSLSNSIVKDADGNISVDSLIAVIDQLIGVNKELREQVNNSLRFPDASNLFVTDKDNRQGKMLSFDDNGKPVCVVKQEDVEKIKEYRYEASTSATSASLSALEASKSKDDAQGIYDDVCDAVEGFDAEVASKTTDFNKNYKEKKDAIDKIASDVKSKADEFDAKVVSQVETINEAGRDACDLVNEAKNDAVGAFDSHVSQKTTEFDSHVSSKKSELNNSVQSKIDEAKHYADEAKKQADEATLISDPDGFRTSTAVSIASLSEAVVGKVNKGELYFNNGKITCSQKWKTNEPFSFIFTMRRPPNSYGGAKKELFATAGNYGSNYGFFVLMDDAEFYFYFLWKKTDGSKGFYSTHKNATAYFDNKKHVWSYVFNGNKAWLSVDNDIVASTSVDSISETENTNPLLLQSPQATISRIKYFNFDITSADAPYTLADYMDGKDEPPNTALLSLSDYSIQRNSTTKVVLDESGNGNNATITGDVCSPKDSAISAFIDELKTQITQTA